MIGWSVKASSKYTKTKTVAFYTLTYMEGRKRHFIDGGAIDWVSVFTRLAKKPKAALTVDGVEFEPRVEHGHGVLIMHKPLSPEFLTKLAAVGPRVDADRSDEESLRRFAKATAVAFIGNGDLIAVGKGGDNTSPGLTYLKVFLDTFVDMGGTASWRTDAFLADADLRRLTQDADSVRQFSFKYHTQRDLFDSAVAQSASFDSSIHSIADSVETDIVVSVDVALPTSATRGQRQRLRNFVRKQAQDLIRHAAGKPPKVVAEIDGIEEELFLMKHRLTRTAEISRESAASGSFETLVAEVVRVAMDTDKELYGSDTGDGDGSD